MQKIKRDDLYSLEEYAKLRPEFRARVMAHKKNRQLQLGEHVTLHFEDRLLMHYQIQEMLRVERIFEEQGIQDELDAYNPLIPDGANWKATMMIEYTDPQVRKNALQRMLGIEERVWMQVQGFEPVYAVADEDLERANEDKTSSVHFLRFQLEPAMAAAVKSGAEIAAGIDHPAYEVRLEQLSKNIRDSLAEDLSAT